MNYLHADLRHIWHPYTPLEGVADPVLIKSAKGIHLFSEDGRRIIDGISSWWVNLHGHSHPQIAEAIYKQANELEHVIFAGFTHRPAVDLAIALKSILPANQEKVFYSDNGSTAVEVAIKMALQYWYNTGHVRSKVIAMEGAYHGDTFGAMSVGDRGLFTRPFARMLFDVEFIPFPDGNNDREVIEQFTSIVATGNVAAFIYEPMVQAAAGMRFYSSATLNEMISIAGESGTLCIADEVFTGFGRTGKMFASDHMPNKPDIITLSKGLTGGTMALGVTTCSEKIVSAFRSPDTEKTFYHGHSFTANPLACAAALASFSLLQSKQCQAQMAAISVAQKAFAAKIKNKKGIERTRSLGTIFACDVVTNTSGSYTHPIRKYIYEFFLGKNILLRPLGNVIYFLPSYAFADRDLEVVYAAIEEFIMTARSE